MKAQQCSKVCRVNRIFKYELNKIHTEIDSRRKSSVIRRSDFFNKHDRGYVIKKEDLKINTHTLPVVTWCTK